MTKTMIELRVAFADTDAMGIVHHANYLKYFEVARVQWLRERGVSYTKWVEKGFHLPLVEAQCRYRKPARFEDVLLIYVKPRQEGARIIFDYEIKNQTTKELITTGVTQHVPVDDQMKMTKLPEDLFHILENVLSV